MHAQLNRGEERGAGKPHAVICEGVPGNRYPYIDDSTAIHASIVISDPSLTPFPTASNFTLSTKWAGRHTVSGVNDAELHLFFEDLVSELRSRGALCAITSGMACVHYGVAETTKDCDLLCHPTAFDTLLQVLEEKKIAGCSCHYRGNISPPLDARWHRGGWTSHFQWDTEPEVTTLDVFGHAIRESSPWQDDISGFYASQNVVAEMKRTDRDKDWPMITPLGKFAAANDLIPAKNAVQPKGHGASGDPAATPDEAPDARPAFPAEWVVPPAFQKPHQHRKGAANLVNRGCAAAPVQGKALRPFALAMGKLAAPPMATLHENHSLRLSCAKNALEQTPIAKHGLERMLEEGRQSTASFVLPEFMQWLPDARPHFKFLIS